MKLHFLAVPKITQESWFSLVNREISALIVPKFVALIQCERLAEALYEHPAKQAWKHEKHTASGVELLDYGIWSVGTPFNTTYGKNRSDPAVLKYYAEAGSTMEEMRRMSAPYPWPMDLIKRDLHEVHGATIAAFEGQRMFMGIGRITEANAKRLAEQPHFDALPAEFYRLDQQFSCVVFYDTPQVGGELELWPDTPFSHEDILHSDPDDNWRVRLGESFLIKPERGMAIFFETTRAHAVRTFTLGRRIASQCFVGYKRDEFFYLWS